MKMKKTVKWTVFLAALALMIGCFASCGGDPKGNPVSGTATSGTSGGAANATDASGNATEPGETVQTDASGNSNPSADNNSKTGSGNKTDSNKTDNNKTNNNSKTTVANSSGNANANDPLKDVETKGKTFTVISTYLSSKRTSSMDLYAELFLERAQEVEKELGCKINIVNSVYPTPEWLAPQIRAGKKVADLLHVEMRQLVPFVSAGYVKAWSDIPGVNVKDSNFNQGITQVSTIGGKTYALSMLKPEEVRYCGIINKTLLRNCGIDPDEIYRKIDDGTWNFDALKAYAQKVQSNSSFKGKAVDADPTYLLEMLMAANNGRLVTMNSAGKATPTYTSANVKEAAGFMDELITGNLYNPKDYATDRFVQGNVAFLFDESWVMAKKIRPNVKNFDYGMIILPKGPSASGYVSGLEHANIFMTTSTNTELDFTAKVLNALAKPSKNQTGSQWWLDEVQLDLFQKNDAKSLNIYQKCLNSATIDLGLCVPTLTTAFKDAVLQNAIIDKKTSVSAAFDSINGKLDGTINDVFKNIGK